MSSTEPARPRAGWPHRSPRAHRGGGRVEKNVRVRRVLPVPFHPCKGGVEGLPVAFGLLVEGGAPSVLEHRPLRVGDAAPDGVAARRRQHWTIIAGYRAISAL